VAAYRKARAAAAAAAAVSVVRPHPRTSETHRFVADQLVFADRQSVRLVIASHPKENFLFRGYQATLFTSTAAAARPATCRMNCE